MTAVEALQAIQSRWSTLTVEPDEDTGGFHARIWRCVDGEHESRTAHALTMERAIIMVGQQA